MNKAVLVQSNDWEGLFINGELLEEGHSLNEGESRISYFAALSKEQEFQLEYMDEKWVSDDYQEKLLETGVFDQSLSNLMLI